ALSYLPGEQADADETARWIDEAGREAVQLPGDITDRETCEALPARTVEALGGLDVLVNNAGFQMARTNGIEELADEHLDRVMKTNLYAMFWLTRAAVPHLSRGSSIINTTSIQAYDPSTTLLDYA